MTRSSEIQRPGRAPNGSTPAALQVVGYGSGRAIRDPVIAALQPYDRPRLHHRRRPNRELVRGEFVDPYLDLLLRLQDGLDVFQALYLRDRAAGGRERVNSLDAEWFDDVLARRPTWMAIGQLVDYERAMLTLPLDATTDPGQAAYYAARLADWKRVLGDDYDLLPPARKEARLRERRHYRRQYLPANWQPRGFARGVSGRVRAVIETTPEGLQWLRDREATGARPRISISYEGNAGE